MITFVLFAVQGFFECRSRYRENSEIRIEYGRNTVMRANVLVATYRWAWVEKGCFI